MAWVYTHAYSSSQMASSNALSCASSKSGSLLAKEQELGCRGIGGASHPWVRVWIMRGLHRLGQVAAKLPQVAASWQRCKLLCAQGERHQLQPQCPQLDKVRASNNSLMELQTPGQL